MIQQLIKYGMVTVLSQGILLGVTFMLVETVHTSPSLAYFIAISLVYILAYILYTTFVFSSYFSKQKLLRYTLLLVCFWGFNNIFFNMLVQMIGVQYMVAVVLNIVLFGFIRFFLQKKIVFTDA